MDIPMNGFVPYEMKTSVIRITSYDNHNMAGTFSNPYYERPVSFSNTTELLMTVEALLDALNCPQKAMESRSFRQGAGQSLPFAPSTSDEEGKPLATFKLNVIFRQNASWQGRLVWVEDKSEAQFRSTLEFLMLIDGVL